MQTLRGRRVDGDARGAVATIGVFDGVHRGHQFVVARVVARARATGTAATVVTFDPHPATVLAPDHAPEQLESLARRLDRLERLGVDQVRVIDFDFAASREDAGSFVDRVLLGELGVRAVVVGEDFHFGRDRAGDVNLLETSGSRNGFAVEALDPVGAPQRFSSTAARALVRAGDLAGAEAVLGHHLILDGTVVHGDGRGTTLGFPTANLTFRENMAWPANGIYVGFAHLAPDEFHAAAISIGRRPQFYASGVDLVEAFLLDYTGDLYGRALDLVLLARLRDERAFPTTADLVEQIDRDVVAAREICRAVRGDRAALLGFTTGQRR